MAPAVTQLVEMVPAGPSALPVAASSAVKPDARAGGLKTPTRSFIHLQPSVKGVLV